MVLMLRGGDLGVAGRLTLRGLEGTLWRMGRRLARRVDVGRQIIM